MSFRDGSQSDLFRFDEVEGYPLAINRSRLKTRRVSGPLYEPFDTHSYSQSSPSLEPWLRQGPRSYSVLNRAYDVCWVGCITPPITFGSGCIDSIGSCRGNPLFPLDYETWVNEGNCSVVLADGDDARDLNGEEHWLCHTEYMNAILNDPNVTNFDLARSTTISFGSCGYAVRTRPCPVTAVNPTFEDDVIIFTNSAVSIETNCNAGVGLDWVLDNLEPCGGGVVISDAGDPSLSGTLE